MPATHQVPLVYDEAGHLIGEYDEHGNAIREYVWLADRPVAMVVSGDVYYIHSDHLNTPQAVIDQNQQVVWKVDYKPFGKIGDRPRFSMEKSKMKNKNRGQITI